MADRSLGSAVLRTRLDTSGLRTGLNTLRSETDSTLRTIEQRLEATGRSLRRVGTGLTIGVTAPLTLLGSATVKAASDAEETRAKFQTVFRDIGSDAQAAADRLSDAFGQSDRAAQALLANTGDLLTGFGFQQKAALDLSQQVNELAIDLASFTNFQGGAEAASAALTSALLGEREAAKSLGIVITEDVVQAKISELRATGDLVGATEQQAKAYATLLIAQEQSKNAIGDFARTQDSFANQSRILASNIDDLKVALGEGILPIVTPLVGRLADAAEALSDMDEGTRTLILAVGGLAAAAGPVLVTFGSLLTVLPAVATGFTTIAVAAAPLLGPAALIAGGIVLVDQLSRRIGDGNVGLIGRVGQAADAIFGWSERQRELNEQLASSISLANSLGSFEGGGEATGGGGGGGARRAPTGGEDEAAVTVAILRERLRSLQDAFADAATESERLEIAGKIRATTAEIDRLTSVLNDNTRSVSTLATTYERTVDDVFNDLAEAGTIAERRSAALGGTIETRLTSVGTRAGLVSSALDEMFAMGLTAADERVQYLVGRFEFLQGEAERLRSILEPGGLSGRLARDGDGGLSRVPTGPEFPQRLARDGDGGLADAVRIENTRELGDAIAQRVRQDDRPTIDEARGIFGSRGRASVLAALGRPGSSGVSDDAISEGELLARQAEQSFDQYLASMPDAATDLSLSAEELTRAAARLTFDQQTSAVLGELLTMRRVGIQYGGDTPGVNFPAPGAFEGPEFVDRRAEGVAPIFDPEVFTREFDAAGRRFREEAVEGGIQTAEEIIGAGQGFVNAIGQFQSGNIGGGIGGLGQTAGGILNAIPGLGLIGGLVGAGAGLLGGIINLFTGGGQSQNVERERLDRSRGVPAVNINVSIDMDNIYNGGPDQPQVEQAFLRQARQMVEELFERSGLLQTVRELRTAS